MSPAFKKLQVFILLPLIVGAGFFFLNQSKRKSALPLSMPTPQFQLTDQEGRPFTQEEFQNKVTLINFIFTNCPTVCPLLTQKMKKISQKIPDDQVRFLTISVDPENDTPAVMKRYGNKFKVDWSRWTFLTGPLDEISKAVIQGFKIAMVKETSSDLLEITHGEYFVLVDSKGMIRSYQMLESPADETLLLSQIKNLTKEIL